MSGMYKIGGWPKNYSNFTTAFSALATNGVNGAVTFIVEDSNYNEKLSISPISGASSTNTVTFKGKSGDSSLCKLYYASSTLSTNNYVIYLNGADYFNFKSMTIERTGYSAYATVVDIEANAINNNFSNCVIKGVKGGSNSTYNLVYSSGNNDNNTEFFNTHFWYGYHGLSFYGNSTTRETGNKAENNIFDSCMGYAIYATYQSGVQITGNIGNNLKSGFYVVNCDNIVVSKNKLFLYNSLYYGYDFRYLDGGSSNTYNYVTNNFASASNVLGGSFSCMVYSACQYTYVLHNNIFVSSNTNFTTRALTVGSCYYSTFIVENNNVQNNSNVGYIYYTDNFYNLTSDYNNFYSTTGLGFYVYNGGTYYSLAAWRTATSKDANSTYEEPCFRSITDLHAKGYNINGKGKYFSTVPKDIDDETRNTSTPDIGADEFTPLTNDISLMDVSPYPYICGPENVKVRIRNNGTNAITSAKLVVQVNNGAYNVFNYTFSPSIKSGKDTLLTITGYSYPTYGLMYTKVFSVQTNGTSDDDAADDTAWKTSTSRLTGTYTIGGSAPDFNDFTQAALVLRRIGVCGPVTFLVRNGTYQESVKIGNIPNVSATNNITFTSEKGDSSKVILQYPSQITGASYVLGFDTAYHITVSKITIRRTGASGSYSSVVGLMGKNDSVTIANCVVKGCYSSGSCIFNNGVPDSNFTIKNCWIQNSLYGVFMSNIYTAYGYRLKLHNNIIDSSYSYCLRLTYSNSYELKGNKFTMLAVMGGPYCADLTYCNYGSIEKNVFLNYNTGDVVRMNSCSTTASLNNYHVKNNYISQLSTSTSSSGTGLYINNGTYLKIVDNNIYVNSGASSNAALYIANSSSSFVVGNNAYTAGTGYAYLVSPVTTSTISISESNNFYTQGTYIAYWNGSRYSGLNNFTAASGTDAKSVSTNPKYVSGSDLHTRSSKINNKGYDFAFCNDDIDGDSRNDSTPDIGADEMTPKTLDASVTYILDPVAWGCSGQDIKIRVKNEGTTPLTSITLSVKCSTNGILSQTYNLGNNITYLRDTVLAIGPYYFNDWGINQVYAWCSKPNGKTDDDVTNDSFNKGIKVRMQGIYYIGGKNKNFTSFADAYSNLVSYGVCAPVTFLVKDSVFTEQLAFQAITGASAINTITFQGLVNDSTKTTLRWPGSGSVTNNHLIYLNGCDYFVFRNMTLERYGNYAYTHIVMMANYAHYNTFDRIRFLGLKGASYTSNSIITEDATYFDSAFTVSNSYFRYGYHAIYAQGSSTGNLESGNKILNCVFDSSSNYPMYILNQTNLTIKGNYVFNNVQGFYLKSCNNKMEISGNKFTLKTGTYGLYLYTCLGTLSNPQIIKNNFISFDGTSNSTSNCIYSFSNTYQYVYNNNFLVYNASNSNAACIGFNSAGSTTLINNNFVVDGSKGYSLYIPTFTTAFASDYNNIYCNSGGNFIWWNYSNYSSLSGYVSASGRDGNSLSVDPKYTSKTDLHVSAKAINNKAKVLTEVTDDFDGEFRSTVAPDMGADEMAPVYENDGGITASLIKNYVSGDNLCPSATVTLSGILKNYGTKTLTSASIKYTLNDTLKGTYNFSGSLASGNTDTLKMGNLIIKMTGTNRIRAWVSLANGIQDSLSKNDTSAYFTLFANTPPSANVGSTQTICKGSSVSIGAAAVSGNTYAWTSNPSGFTSTSANPSVSPSVNTWYILTEKSGKCQKTDSVQVKVNPLPTTDAGKDISTCFGIGVTIGKKAVSGYTYYWTTSQTIAGFPSIYAQNTVALSSTTTFYLTETITATGCSNTDTMTVFVNPFPSANVGSAKTICSGSSTSIGATAVSGNTYSWKSNPAGFTSTSSNPSVSPTTSTWYILTEKITATGCAKTDSVLVTVNSAPAAATGSNKSICSGNSTSIGASAVSGNTYSWTSNPSGFTSTAANPSVSPTVTTTYTLTEKITATGCTNTNSVTITVNPLPAANVGSSQSICYGNSASIGATSVSGNTYAWTSSPTGFNSNKSNPTVSPTVSTTYTLVETITATGCTKSNNVTIFVNPLPSASVGSAKTICNGKSTSIGATAVSGNTYAWTSKPSGFTSTVSNPSVNPTVSTWYYLIEKITATTCTKSDSVLVTVKPTSSYTYSKNICSGDSVLFNGSYKKKTGSYSYTSTNYVGCDSVITLNLKVNLTTSSTVNAAICQGKSYYFNNAYLTKAGTYYDTIPNKAGCDSFITLVLKVNQSSSSTINASFCKGSSYTFGGNKLTAAGTYYDTLLNAAGCDSFITLYLKMNQPSASSISASICKGVTYYFHKTYLNTAGTYYDTLVNAVGCDSVITLTLKVKPTSSNTINAAICKGSSYSFGGNNLTVAGTYYDTLTNSVGCDSVITLILKVKATSSSTINAAICKGSTYSFGGNNLSAAGTYYDTLTNSVGCDSVITLNLKVNYPSYNTINAAICKGSSYSFGGNNLTASGTYYDTLLNAVKCDSIITLNLVVNNPSSSTINQSICDNSFFIFGGNKLSKAGTYYDTLKNQYGCDSVVTLNLSLIATTSSTINAAICKGGTYSFGGNNLTTAGTYYDTILNHAGCDSFITLNLKVNNPSSSTLNASICNGTYYTFGGNKLTAAGTYYDTLMNASGCDSVVTLNLNIKPTSSSKIAATICDGSVYVFGGNNLYMQGVYYDTLTNSGGCDSVIELTLTVNPAPTADAGIDRIICEGSSASLGTSAISGFSYKWYTASGINFSNNATVNVSPANPGFFTYYVVVTNTTTSCVASDTVTISVTAKPQTPSISSVGTDSLRCSSTASTYLWYKNGNFLSANTQTIKHSGSGTYRVIAANDSCNSDTSAAYVLSGVNELQMTNYELRIYPNPTKGILNIDFINPTKQEVEIKIYDMLGNLCHAEPVEAHTQTITLDMSVKAKGVYLIECVSKDGVVRKKVVLE